MLSVMLFDFSVYEERGVKSAVMVVVRWKMARTLYYKYLY